MPDHGYIRRVDAVRVLLMAAVILSVYRLPVRYARYFALLCEFAPCALFALFGYFVLKPYDRSHRPGRCLRRTLPVFAALLCAYTLLGCFYQWLYNGHPFAWINLPNLLTFLVFCKWPVNLGDSIWMIQTVLYALAVFSLFHRLPENRVLDTVISAVLMMAGVVFGEMAGVLRMPVYVERNFLTTTIPYMLLGKLIWYAPEKLRNCGSKRLIILFGIGVVLCAAEAYFLRSMGMIDYCEHLLGFIPMTAATVLFAVRGPQKEGIDSTDISLIRTYRLMYYLFNPIAEFYFLLAVLLIGFPRVFNVAVGATAVAALVLTFIISRFLAKKFIYGLPEFAFPFNADEVISEADAIGAISRERADKELGNVELEADEVKIDYTKLNELSPEEEDNRELGEVDLSVSESRMIGAELGEVDLSVSESEKDFSKIKSL